MTPANAHPSRPIPSLLLSCAFALTSVACGDKPSAKPQPVASCSARVTDGNGSFWAVTSASAGSSPKPLRRQALKEACEVMCEQRKASPPKKCVARCVVDAAAAKIGVRISCSGTAE